MRQNHRTDVVTMQDQRILLILPDWKTDGYYQSLQ